MGGAFTGGHSHSNIPVFRMAGMIIYKQRGILVAEVWFCLPSILPSRLDVVFIRRSLKPIAGYRNDESHTLLNDLSLSWDELWNGMCKENRYEIRRAETKDGLSYKILTQPTVQDYVAFVDFYRIFTTQKGLPDSQSNTHAALRRCLANGNLTLTKAGKDDETLVWHSYFVQGNQCRLLFSASHFRSSTDTAFTYLVGRCNRWLHWQDMLYFQAQGITVFDWGGWHVGADAARLRINQFKEGFGGKPVQVYDARYGITLRGHLENTIVRLVHQWRKWRSPPIWPRRYRRAN